MKTSARHTNQVKYMYVTLLLLVHQINHYELWKKITKYKSEIKCKVIIGKIIVFLWGRELGKSGCRNVLVLFYKQGSV